MPTWGEILVELQQLQGQGTQAVTMAFDIVRRKYLLKLCEYTKNSTVLYATRWTQPLPELSPEFTSITYEDIQGLMEVLRGLSPGRVDIILHSPGGSAEAVEAMVSYIRSKFSYVRVFIPHAAMSAATMLACSANKIVMGTHSFLGPIDPQLALNTPLGVRFVPAQAILDQFRLAKEECQDPKLLAAWLPMLSQYGPALITQCNELLGFSKELVSTWLNTYMFEGYPDAGTKAQAIAETLANHSLFKTHGRQISREQAKLFGLLIDDLEVDNTLQDLILSVFHATMHTFNGTTATKIIENNLGRAYVKTLRQVPVQTAPPRSIVPAQPGPARPPTEVTASEEI